MSEMKTSILKVTDLLKVPTSRSAWLVVVSGGARVGAMYPLDAAEVVIGRASDAGVVLDDEGASRRHAWVVHREDGLFVLEDRGSTNGTFVNGERVGTHVLSDGDKIQIGATILRFDYQDSFDAALQRDLFESATRDGLTRVMNKKTFLDLMVKELAFSRRHSTPLSLVMLDIDHFKTINDTWGHLAGDAVLVRLAAEVQGTTRTEDVLARYGGEEFVLVLRQTARANAFVLAERVRVLVERTEFVWEGQRIPVTVSLGIAEFDPATHEDASAIIGAADERLYEAKHAGRNRVC